MIKAFFVQASSSWFGSTGLHGLVELVGWIGSIGGLICSGDVGLVGDWTLWIR